MNGDISRKVQISFVKDLSPELQAQYFRQRNDWMSERVRLENYSAKKDQFDDNSFAIAVVKNNIDIIGGLRLTISDTTASRSLPSEVSVDLNDPPFLYKDYFPENYQSTETIGEISKLFILDEGKKK